MPRISVECFCGETNPEGSDASWTTITACGHLFHTVCIKEWIRRSLVKSDAVCPSCRTVIDGKSKSLPSKRRQQNLVRLYLQAELASDGASQMPEEPLDDPIEDSSDDEDVSPVKKLELKNEELQKRVVKLTGEMRTLAFSKKDLLKEVKEKEREMEGVKEELSRQEGANAKLVKENLELETRLQHQVLQIATQKETLDDWEQGQPAVRLDLERVRTELAAITQDFAWTVDDNGKREQVHQDTQEELRVEKEKRALEREHLEGRIRKLDERVKLEGSAGRERIKELHHEVNRLTEQLSTDRIDYDERYDTLASKMEAMETAHLAQTARDAARMSANSRRVEDAEAKQNSAADEITRLQSGNAAWKVKYDKLNDKFKALQNRGAPVVNESPESSPLRVGARPSKTASPPPAVPAFKIKNTASLLHPSRQTEFDIELEDDELESYRDRDEDHEEGELLDQYSPRKKSRTDGTMSTLIDRDVNSSFGVKRESLSKNAADQHIPNLFLSTGKLDAGRKIKGKKGFSR